MFCCGKLNKKANYLKTENNWLVRALTQSVSNSQPRGFNVDVPHPGWVSQPVWCGHLAVLSPLMPITWASPTKVLNWCKPTGNFGFNISSKHSQTSLQHYPNSFNIHLLQKTPGELLFLQREKKTFFPLKAFLFCAFFYRQFALQGRNSIIFRGGLWCQPDIDHT